MNNNIKKGKKKTYNSQQEDKNMVKIKKLLQKILIRKKKEREKMNDEK